MISLNKKILHRILSELKSFLDMFLRYFPGIVGYKLRSQLLSNRINNANNLFTIGVGVYINGYNNIKIGNGVVVGNNCAFDCNEGKLSIGSNTRLNHGVILGADNGEIKIGNDVLIGPYTVLRASNHRFDESPDKLILEQGHTKGIIVIGNDVWIGANVTILPGTMIEDHCVIGAGSVVRGIVPTCTVSAGVPIKILKKINNNLDNGNE